MHYTKKPVTIEAMQFGPTAVDAHAVTSWMEQNDYPGLIGDATRPGTLEYPTYRAMSSADYNEFMQPNRGWYIEPANGNLVIRTLEGDMVVQPMDYVIKGIKGEFYPCKPDIFEESYDESGGNQLMRIQAQVREFHQAMGQPVGLWVTPLSPDRVPVRWELLREEAEDELLPALQSGDLVETVDACIDIMYVTLGLLVEMGVNAGPLFDEVHRSNMSKFGADGKPIIAGPNDPDGIFEGRVKKGPDYFKPDLKLILESGAADLGRAE